MKSTHTSSLLVAPLCWAALGFAFACLAAPVLPWHAADPETRAPRAADPGRALVVTAVADTYVAGGPGPEDDTEWMPGNR